MTDRGVAFGVLLVWAVVGVTSPAAGDAKLGAWLVQEGRSYALTSQARATEADARIVLALMQAASEAAPQLVEAYRWQFEMASLLGEAEVARAALRNYTAYWPVDVTRRLQWIEAQVSERQTAEERLAWLELIVEASTAVLSLADSDIHRRMAELLYGQGRTTEADQHIAQALALFPGNIAARQLRDDFHQAIPAREAEAAFRLLVLEENPTLWEGCFSLAKELDCLGLRAEAREWYQRARSLLERAEASGPLLAEVLLEMARSCKSEGKGDEARLFCLQALEKNPESVAAHMLADELCPQEDDEEGCVRARAWLEGHHEQVATRWAEKPEAMSAAALSWYYGRCKGDLDRAVEYGDRAVALAPDNPVVCSCAGYAHLWAGQAERAAELLAAPATVDGLAAVGLAESCLQIGRREEGVNLLKEVAAACASGEAYDEAVAALQRAGQEAPALPETAKISEMLAAFDQSKLDFAFDPDRYLMFRVDLVAPITDTLAPWELIFVMLNRSEFDITLGADKMLDPRVAISFELRGEVEADFEGYSVVTLDERPVLRPGQLMSIARTVDTGSLREFLWRTAQVDYEVRVGTILSPALTAEGKWVRSPFGPAAYEFSFQRPGLVATPSNVERLLTAVVSEDPRARMPATEKLVALWAEQQVNQRGPERYAARSIPLDRIREVVAQRWNDADQAVRLHTLGALRLINLSDAEIGSLATLLHHEDPLTRMEAVLLMADQQGATFLPVAKVMAERDPDLLVRQLCGGFRDNWTGLRASTP